jgi:hypothetical protein
LVSLLEELGESEEAEDWWQRLVEFRPGSAAEGELSTVPGSEASEDLPSSSENQEIHAVGGELLDEQIKDVLEHEKIKQKKGCESMFSPVIWAAKPASACRILKCRVRAAHPDIFQRCPVPANPEEHAGAESRLKV